MSLNYEVAIDSSGPLLGCDEEPLAQRWKEDVNARSVSHRRWIWALTALLILLTIFVVAQRQWPSEFDAQRPKLLGHPVTTQEPEHERNLKWLLHPEDHVSREPSIRHFSWNVTKATRAPNGVRKDVFLINGEEYPFHLMIRKCLLEQTSFPVLQLRPGLVIPSRSRSSMLLRKKCLSTGMDCT